MGHTKESFVDPVYLQHILGGIEWAMKPNTDIVDNAKIFVELDTYSLINCIDGLFSKEAAES